MRKRCSEGAKHHGGQPPMMHQDRDPVLAPGAIAEDRGRDGRELPLVEASLGNHPQELLQILDIVLIEQQVLQGCLVAANVRVKFRTLPDLRIMKQVIKISRVQKQNVLATIDTSSNSQFVQ